MTFLSGFQGNLPSWSIALENAASATFIGSVGNIPLATVWNSNGVLFAGIMGFICSDLMVPPLVRVNAKYHGWKMALHIATTMLAGIVLTALILNGVFSMLGNLPESGKAGSSVSSRLSRWQA